MFVYELRFFENGERLACVRHDAEAACLLADELASRPGAQGLTVDVWQLREKRRSPDGDGHVIYSALGPAG